MSVETMMPIEFVTTTQMGEKGGASLIAAINVLDPMRPEQIC
jgi:hypothetical protein